jgi:hypothetical protein
MYRFGERSAIAVNVLAEAGIMQFLRRTDAAFLNEVRSAKKQTNRDDRRIPQSVNGS